MYAFVQIYQERHFIYVYPEVHAVSACNQSSIFQIYLLPTRLRLSSCLCLGFASSFLKVLFLSCRDIPLIVQTILYVAKDVQSNHRLICKKNESQLTQLWCGGTSHVA